MFFRWAVAYQSEMSFTEFKEACQPVENKSDEKIKQEVRELFS